MHNKKAAEFLQRLYKDMVDIPVESPTSLLVVPYKIYLAGRRGKPVGFC